MSSSSVRSPYSERTPDDSGLDENFRAQKSNASGQVAFEQSVYFDLPTAVALLHDADVLDQQAVGLPRML